MANNRQDDLFHLIGKLEASLEAVKERKIGCDKCFAELENKIREVAIMVENHKNSDSEVHNKIWRYIYYSYVIGGISLICYFTIAKDSDTVIIILKKLLSIF